MANCKACGASFSSSGHRDLCPGCERALKRLDGYAVPVVRGQWDGEGDGYAETEDGEIVIVYDVWNCSKCGYTIDDGTDDPELLPNYCPNCGAKMDLGI